MKTHDFKKVEENTQVTHTFTFDKDIKSVSCGCGCSTPSINKNKATIKVNTGEFPRSFKKIGKDTYTTTKSCSVYFTDNTTEQVNLTFTLNG